eukprot:gnl/Carplike_NY0171/273_a385_4594.p1 GENE.gnl/Carplike_NY0171/273_a385_4594~~gnl/Carplike_NY0171/273_a385_4594.p1  ORF type:complete len:111 (+),score=16.00 gnl/Carplike_NY0171/273_a385_4594:94-426(+)
MYKINDEMTEVVVDRTFDVETTWEQLKESLPEKTPRYIVYDCKYEDSDGATRTKLVFIAWSPDSASIKDKMVYASSREGFRSQLSGCHISHQATDFDEFSLESVISRCRL